MLRIRPRFHKTVGTYRTPQPLRRQLPFQGRFGRTNLLPPLGEVPRSGKGGAVGDFEQFPFNERHPLSLADARQLPHRGAEFNRP